MNACHNKQNMDKAAKSIRATGQDEPLRKSMGQDELLGLMTSSDLRLSLEVKLSHCLGAERI